MMIPKQALIGAAALLIAAALPAHATTQHDNEVFFSVPGITEFSFTQTGHSVTKGQPFGGTTTNVNNPGAQARMVIKAGRKGSTPVAEWFKSQIGAGQTLACDSAGVFPKDLNFAVQGTLSMVVGNKKITCQDVLIGQGHFVGANNWWMGGPQMQGVHVVTTGATFQSCKAEGKLLPVKVTFTPQTPCVNHFNMSVIELK